jgi:S-adenosylmethionine:tRNA ribosyltransferase-isomerase
MRTDELDFELPSALIAQTPTADRPASRLLHYTKKTQTITHRRFTDLPLLLRAGDLLVFNNARVVPARFVLIKPTGGRAEGLFVSQIQPNRWDVLLKNIGPGQPGSLFSFEDGTPLRLVTHHGDGRFTIELEHDTDAIAFLERVGRMPLPPYIKRERISDTHDALDRARYQTIYAQAPGSVAAPTAGLHFDETILAELEARDIERTFVTLHVGMGTFKPVNVDELAAHTMHVEKYAIDAATASAINAARRDGRRVIAVGTTAARVLESQPADEPIKPASGETGIFIYPPYRWRHIDALLTNFHLPRSTLIALVAAWVGIDAQRKIYAEAIAEQYRFFSYGDSSFLE